MAKTKSHVIETITHDAPFGVLRQYTVSFMTPNHTPGLEPFHIRGIKIYHGYEDNKTDNAQIKKDISAIRARNPRFDIFVGRIGHLQVWDDANSTDAVYYDDEKLNSIEETCRESQEKRKLLTQQIRNEAQKNASTNSSQDRLTRQRERMLKRLHDRGIISEKERQNIQESQTKTIYDPASEPSRQDQLAALLPDIQAAASTDYVDEEPPNTYHYGILTIYSPVNYINLKSLHYKIRGLFETLDECQRRVAILRRKNDRERTYILEVGKWCVFSEKGEHNATTFGLQFNYCMKIYNQVFEREMEEFATRKDQLQKMNHNETAERRRINRGKNRHKTADSTAPPKPSAPPATSTRLDTVGINPADKAGIQSVLDFINEPEITNRFQPHNKKGGETICVDIPPPNKA